MSIATGRDPEALTLLQNPPALVQIAIPCICCLEALSVLEQEEKSRKNFEQELDIQINRAQRNRLSHAAQSIVFHLRQVRDNNQTLIGETKAHLFQAFNQIWSQAELMALTADMLESSWRQIIIQDRTDNLILHCILGHAREHPRSEKVFLSGNVKDFGTSKVREALRQAGVSHYFSRTQDFIGWLQSQT
ncbi:MAG: hypothetical protein GDA43_15535 [Hormoscilla sp. SP5CHS1]|nr:hypothetical protein [Hormoscilla sp. SP12CHS1]MBC6454431.1 hypothetical protein [Hormoscilla sp. SP5CHS1]